MSNRYTENDSEFLHRIECRLVSLSEDVYGDSRGIAEVDLVRLSVLADRLAEAEAWVRGS